MSGAVFKTYDTMLGMAKSRKDAEGKPEDPLIFYGKIRPTLANYTNTSITQLYEHIEWLCDNHWLIPQERQRWPNGRLGTVIFWILEHDRYVAEKCGECPPAKYDEGGKIIKKNEKGELRRGTKQPLAFRKAAIDRRLKAMMQQPEWKAWVAALSTLGWSKKDFNWPEGEQQ
jgi:hypothetical protein